MVKEGYLLFTLLAHTNSNRELNHTAKTHTLSELVIIDRVTLHHSLMTSSLGSSSSFNVRCRRS